MSIASKRPSTTARAWFIETQVNPTLDLIDIALVRRWMDEARPEAGENGRMLMIVDNTFATPFCQRPLARGADFVVHSLTKDIGGFGTDMGGAVIGPLKYHAPLLMYRKDFGGVLSSKRRSTLRFTPSIESGRLMPTR